MRENLRKLIPVLFHDPAISIDSRPAMQYTRTRSTFPPQHAERSWGKYTGNRRIVLQNYYIN